MTISWLAVRRTGIAAGVMLLAMLVLWWSLWTIGAAQYQRFIDGWIAAHGPAGYRVQYDSRETTGFPRSIVLHFRNFVLQNADGIRIHADDVELSTLPWQWHRLDAECGRGFDISIPFGDDRIFSIATAATATSHIELAGNGDWQSVSLRLTDPKALWAQTPFFGADTLEVALARPGRPPKDHTETGLDLTAAAENVTLPADIDAPFGMKVKKIDAAMRVTDAVPDPRHREAVAAWNTGGGAIQFDKLALAWGPLLLSVKGALALDDDLQPEGVFSGLIGNQRDVLKALMDHGFIAKRQAGMLDSALSLFAKQAHIGGEDGIEVPITVQLGGLYLGPVKVFYFPEIAWEGTMPPVNPETPAAAP